MKDSTPPAGTPAPAQTPSQSAGWRGLPCSAARGSAGHSPGRVTQGHCPGIGPPCCASRRRSPRRNGSLSPGAPTPGAPRAAACPSHWNGGQCVEKRLPAARKGAPEESERRLFSGKSPPPAPPLLLCSEVLGRRAGASPCREVPGGPRGPAGGGTGGSASR